VPTSILGRSLILTIVSISDRWWNALSLAPRRVFGYGKFMDEKLVQIRIAPDRPTAELEEGLLKENGIKSMIKADPQASGVFMGVFGGFSPMSPWLIYVKESDVQKARDLLGVEKGGAQTEKTPMRARRKRGLWYMVSLIALIIALLGILL
jgi:hypothetical protein